MSQSAASAAGVTPPVTKWNMRGPAEATEASMPALEELLERRDGSVRLLRERPAERASRLIHPLGEERALIERTEIPARLGRDEGEHIVELAGMHG